MNDHCPRCGDTRSVETFDYDMYGTLYTYRIPCPECVRSWTFLYFVGAAVLFAGITFFFKT